MSIDRSNFRDAVNAVGAQLQIKREIMEYAEFIAAKTRVSRTVVYRIIQNLKLRAPGWAVKQHREGRHTIYEAT